MQWIWSLLLLLGGLWLAAHLENRELLDAFSRPQRRVPPTRRLTQLRKKMVAARDRWSCQLCGKVVDATYEIDHVVAVADGGGDDLANLRLLCRPCHGRVTNLQRLR